MIKFDRLKIIAPIAFIKHYEDNPQFEVTKTVSKHKGQTVEKVKYTFSNKGWLAKITVDTYESKMIIEMSGKTLMNRYTELLNKESIEYALLSLEISARVKLDRQNIIRHGEVVSCDVTFDTPFPANKNIYGEFRANLNSPKWNIECWSNNNIVLRKTVKTNSYKRRVTVYDKNKELELAENQYFLSRLPNKDEVLAYFEDKVRLELNLKSKQSIREDLKIPDNRLRTVLNSTANPLKRIVHDALKFPEMEETACNMNGFEKLTVLKYYKYDIPKIKAKASAFYKDTSGLNKVIARYQKLAATAMQADFDWFDQILDQAS